MRQLGHRLAGILAMFVSVSMLIGVFVVAPEKAEALSENATFQGIVSDSSGPVEGAYVKAMLMMGDGLEMNYSFTDSSGYYHMSVPGGLTYMVFVADGRYLMTMNQVSIVRGETKWVNFTLTPVGAPTDVLVKGFVKDELGTPRSDGRVLGIVFGPSGVNGIPYYANLTVPDVSGYFEVNITAAPNGGGAVAMDFDGYPMAQNGSDTPLASGNAYWFNLTLQPRVYNDNAELSGLVTETASGTPLLDAVVTVEVDLGMGNRYSNFTLTDPSGHYTMGVQSGNARITVQKFGYSMKSFDGWPIALGPNSLDAQLILCQAKIRGNVSDLSTGSPMSMAQVILSDQQGNLSFAYTNETGFYELDAFVGTDLVLAARQDGYSTNYTFVNVSVNDELWHDFGIWPATAWMTGSVTDAGTGDFLGGVHIHLFSSLFETWLDSNSTGYYNVSVVPGSYTVEAWAGGYWPFVAYDVQTFDGVGTVFDISMVPFLSASINGTVYDAISMARISGARISASAMYYYYSMMTDSDGNYSMDIPGGNITVSASAPGYVDSSRLVEVANFTNSVVDFYMLPNNPPTTVLLHGNVTDSSTGLPVMNATVRVNLDGGSYQNQTSSNDTGYYEINVPPWTINVAAWGSNYGPAFATQNTSGFTYYTIDLQLPPDNYAPNITTYIQTPENVSQVRPLSLFVEFEESYLKDVAVMILQLWNSTGNHSNYTTVGYWGTSFDPLNPRSQLNLTRSGDNYTMSFSWNTSTDGGYLHNMTDSKFLPGWLLWNGSGYTVGLRGYYTNATVTDIPGTALFDFVTGQMLGFYTDMMGEIRMPDPTGVFTPVASIAEFSGGSIDRFENRALDPWPVDNLTFEYSPMAPSGSYKVIFSVSDWSHGNGRTPNMTVDNTPPVAVAGPNQNVIENTTVNLNGSGSSDNIGIVSYEWTYIDAYGDLITLNGMSVSCSFNSTGVYALQLNVTDDAGWWNTSTLLVTVGPDVPPTAVAGNDMWVDEDTVIQFNGSASHDDIGIVNYTWTIVELSVTMYDVSPQYVFNTPGVYTVELLVRDTIGQWSAPNGIVVTVNDTTAPTADPGPPQFVNLGTAVTLNGSASSDNVGIVNFTWSFFDAVSIVLYGQTVAHNFSAPGSYVVTLEVRDAAGNSDSKTVSITINGPPVANAGPDQKVNVGSTVAFDGSGTTDDLNALAQLNLTWTFTYNSVAQTRYGVAPTFLFAISGQYTVTLTVRDTMGLSSNDTMVLTVNGPPVANAGSDQLVNEGTTVTFDGTMSADDLDSLAQLNFTWSLSYSGPKILYGSAPTFQFLIPGTYVVTLTVTDTGGLTDASSVTVTVNSAPAANAGPDQLVNTGSLVTFNASQTTDDLDVTSSLNFTWNFTYGGSPVTLYGISPSFVFSQGGVYDVWLTVRDGGGLTGVDDVNITVNVAPVARAGSDQGANYGATIVFDGSTTTDDLDILAALNLTWSFTYAGTPHNLWGVSPSFVFGVPGSYGVTLTVIDSNGLSSTDQMIVTINGPPEAHAGPDQSVVAWSTVIFDGSMSTDDAGASALNYTWSMTVGVQSVTLYGDHPTYVFTSTGAYSVTLIVTDAGGLTSSDSVTITVTPSNTPPVANAGSDQVVKGGSIVLFDAGATTDDGGVANLNFTWQFVYDGRTQTLYGPQPSFVFDIPGTYTVTLVVTDAGSLTSTDSMNVTVQKKAESFVSQYWWSLVVIVLAAVALTAMLLLRRRGMGGSGAETEEQVEEEPKEKVRPPPDEEEL